MSTSKEKTNQIVNGKANGYWSYFWSIDNLYFRGNYINGIRDGWWEIYYINKNICAKGNYINGEADGWWEIYEKDGTLKDIMFHINI